MILLQVEQPSVVTVEHRSARAPVHIKAIVRRLLALLQGDLLPISSPSRNELSFLSPELL